MKRDDRTLFLDAYLDPDDTEPVWVMRCQVRCMRQGKDTFAFELQAVDFGTGWPRIDYSRGEEPRVAFTCAVGGPMAGPQHYGPWLDLGKLKPIDLKLLREGCVTKQLLAEAKRQFPIPALSA